jgi:hypothetical protein
MIADILTDRPGDCEDLGARPAGRLLLVFAAPIRIIEIGPARAVRKEAS